MDVGQDWIEIILHMVSNLLTKLFENSWEKSNLLQTLRQANVTLILKKNKRAEECPPAIPTKILTVVSKVVSVIPAHGLDYLTVWIKVKILIQEKSISNTL